MSEEGTSEFATRLNGLIQEYTVRMSNAECLGILKLMSDHISEKVRNERQGPHELS